MPPPQCPECARFLSNAFVVGLGDEPAPCPRCGTVLTVDADGAPVPASEAAPAETAPAGATAPPAAEPREVPEPPSVRPPDLPAAAVRDRDVLEGWDEEALPGRAPAEGTPILGFTPAELGTIVGAGLVGGLMGAWLAGEYRRLGATVGAAAAAGMAASVAIRTRPGPGLFPTG